MIENELIMLDACLSDPDALAAITADVNASDFQTDEARTIYSAILKLKGQDLAVDYLNVKKESGQELEWWGNYYFMPGDIAGRIRQLKADAAKARLADDLKRLALQAEKCPLDEAQAALRALNDRQQGITSPVLRVSPTADWLSNEPPPQEFIFEGVLVAGITGEIHAVGGVGKSFFFNSLLFSLCTGADIFDTFRPTRAYKVMHLPAEDSPDVVRRRLYWMARDMDDGERATVQQAIDENLILCAGQPLPLLELRDGNPVESEGFRALMALVKQYRPDVLMLDPKSMFCGSLDENNNAHCTAFVACLKKFNEIGITVIFSHHESKALAGNGSQFSSRGGQALSDGVRWQVSLSRMITAEAETYGVDAQDYIKVEQTKSNYTKYFQPFWLRRNECGSLDLADLQDIQHDRVIQAVKQVLDGGITCQPRELEKTEGKEFRKRVKELSGATGKDLKQHVAEGMLHGVFKRDEKGRLCAA